MHFLRTAPELSSSQSREILAALAQLPKQGEKIYDERNQQLYRLQAGDLDLVAKIYHLQSAKWKLSALLKHSRGRRSYRSGTQLLKLGIPTPMPLLLKEEGTGLSIQKVTLVCAYFEGLTLREHLRSEIPLPDDAVDQLVAIFTSLHQANLHHGDFHTANLLVSPNGKFTLIDLDGMKKQRTSSESKLLRDKARLLRSIEEDAKETHFYDAVAKALGPLGKPLPFVTST